jgi:hypothetical protein
MLDISLSGCSLKVDRDFKDGALASVKLILPIHGILLSMWGTTQWVKGARTLGIKFIHPTARSRNQLAGLLTCLLDKSAAVVVKKALADAVGRADSLVIELEHPPKQEEEQEEVVVPEKRPVLKSEHKVLRLDAGESPGMLHMVVEGISLKGDMMDLGLEGCIMKLARDYDLRMDIQVEVEFNARGLPFRLPALTKEMHDGRLAEIHFTAMSKRKQGDLLEVIAELIALQAKGAKLV